MGPQSYQYNGYNVIKIESLSDVPLIEQRWTQLLQKNNSTNPYIDPAFFTNLFKHRAYNSRPYILLFSIDDDPKSILIGWSKISRIPFWVGYFKFFSLPLKTLEIEIGGILTDDERNSEEIIIRYLNRLLIEKTYDIILANHFNSEHPLYNKIKSGRLYRKPVFKPGKEWIAKLSSNNSISITTGHNSKTVNSLRRRDRKLERFFKGDIEIKKYSKGSDIIEFLGSADKIGRKSYQNSLGVAVLNNDYYLNLFRALCDGNHFRGYLLFANGIPISYYIGIIYKDVFYSFYTAYDSQYRSVEPGGYLIRYIMKELAEEGFEYFHFGYGDAEHKKFYGNLFTEEATFKIYGASFKSLSMRIVDLTVTYINGLMISLSAKFNSLNRIKKFWRELLSG